MRRPEQNFWQTIRSHVPREVWAQRVENGLVPGMPDVFVTSKHGKQSWMELKVIDEPVRKTTCWLKRGDLRLPQINWHMKAAVMNIPTFIVLRTNKKEMFIAPGKHAPEIHNFTFMEWQDWRIYGWQDFWDIFI